MRANLKEDIIVNFTESGTTEVGIIPRAKKKVGLERLRFNGRKIVDLADLSTIYVRQLAPGAYEFHAVKVLNSQPVQMHYRDKKKLKTDPNGAIRVMSEEEVQTIQEAEKITRINNRKNRALRKLLDQDFVFKLLFALIIYSRTGNAQIGTFFDELIPIIQNMYDWSVEKKDIKDTVISLKRAIKQAAAVRRYAAVSIDAIIINPEK